MSPVDYPIALAVEDFVPVLLTGIGLLVVARWNGRRVTGWRTPALVGVGLVVAGGLAKASWKLVVALTDGSVDLVVADRALFVLLAPGYLLITLGVSSARFRPWLLALPAVVLGAAAVGASLDWDVTRLSLLAVAAVSSVVLSLVLASRSRREGLSVAAGLFALHAVLVVVLGGLGRIADPSVAMQWVDQLVNTAAQAGFLVAALRLARASGPAPAVATATSVAPGTPVGPG